MTKIRSYPLSLSEANAGKLKTLESDLFPLWNSLLTIAKQNYIAKIKTGSTGRLLKDERVIPYPEVFNARTIKAAENQVYAAFAPWFAKAKKIAAAEIHRLHSSGEISDQELRDLFSINMRKSWWTEAPELAKVILSKQKWPNFAHTRAITIYNGFNGEVRESREAEHELWLEMRQPDGSKLNLPVVSTDYFQRMTEKGELKNSYNLIFRKSGRVELTQAVELPDENRERTGEVINLDWGLKALFTSQSGDQYGRWIYEWLLERDEELMELQSQLQKLKVPPKSSKRYRKLQSRISSTVKNEIGRILNKLDSKDISAITVESLDFRGSGLSKKLNRIISRAGRSAVNQKLKSLQEDGVEIVEVNPAYTSQMCSSCGYVDRTNRKGEKFQCLFCGRKINADVNGARNIGDRRSAPNDGFDYWTKEKIRAKLDEDFQLRWGTSFAEFSLRKSRPRNRATGQGSPHRLTNHRSTAVAV